MGISEKFSEIRSLPKSRLLESDELGSEQAQKSLQKHPVPPTGNFDVNSSKSASKNKRSLWKEELNKSASINLLIENKEGILTKKKAQTQIELDINRSAGVGPPHKERTPGRPRVRDELKSSLLRLNSPAWFKRVLESIIKTQNEKLNDGQKKWGMGRAMVWVYCQYEELKTKDQKRLEKIAKKILEIYVRSLQVRDEELKAQHGEVALKKAFLKEVGLLNQILEVCNYKDGYLKENLSREVYRRLSEITMQAEIIKREVL